MEQNNNYDSSSTRYLLPSIQNNNIIKSGCNFYLSKRKQKNNHKNDIRYNSTLTQINIQYVKYFYFDSQDQYIRKILIRNGWIQSSYTRVRQIDLVWIYNNQKYNYQNCSHKLINHFKNNHLITTKAGLKQTLYKNGNIQNRVSRFFPRSYDLHNQMTDFLKDFQKTSMLNLLKKHIIYIQISFDLKKQRIKTYQSIDISQKFMKWITCKKKFKIQSNPNFIFNKRYLVYLIIYLEKLKNNLDVFIDSVDYDSDQQLYKIPSNLIDQIIQFSKIDPPYHILQFEDQDLWGTPTEQCLQLLFSYQKFFKNTYPFYSNDGFNNIWIIKPSQSSKGRNMQLISEKRQIKNQSNTCRIIQKYIQNIWIFTQKQLEYYKNRQIPTGLNLLLKKKFDIRLWVLVKSFQPLEIYLFSEGYLRLTSKHYSLSNLKNFRQHLTNYSVNKQNFNKQQSYVLLSIFLNHIKNVYGYTNLMAQIQQIIIKTLKSAQIQQSSQCFELYGFDILLDCDLKPWLLQVNLSPACDQRGKLKQILYEMGEGLLYQIGLIKKKQLKYKWRNIYKQNLEQQQITQLNQINLQILGKRINKQDLIRIQMKNLILESILKIQRFFRMKNKKINNRKQQIIKSRIKILISILSKCLKKFNNQKRNDFFQIFKKGINKSIRIRKSKQKIL